MYSSNEWCTNVVCMYRRHLFIGMIWGVAQGNVFRFGLTIIRFRVTTRSTFAESAIFHGIYLLSEIILEFLSIVRFSYASFRISPC